MLDHLGVLISCALPSLLFYGLTHGAAAAPSHAVLAAVALLQLVIPIAFNGGGHPLALAVAAFLSCYACFGMVRYMAGEDRQEPFYKVLGRWNDRKAAQKRQDCAGAAAAGRHTEVTRVTMRRNAVRWLGRALLAVGVSVPVMAFLDGFLRMCIEPLEVPYMAVLLSAPHRIPLRTLVYHAVAGTAFLMHVVFVPSFIQLAYSIELLVRLLVGSDENTLTRRYAVIHAYMHSSPLFDRPWLSASIHELWSRRWHQILRWAFQDIVYTPICRALARFPAVGRAVATMAVFGISGFVHDYLLMAMFGYREYLRRPGTAGFQTLFFLLQGAATIASRQSRLGLPVWLARMLTWLFILYTAPLFIEPFLRIGLHREAEMPGYPRWFDAHMGPVCPYGSRG